VVTMGKTRNAVITLRITPDFHQALKDMADFRRLSLNQNCILCLMPHVDAFLAWRADHLAEDPAEDPPWTLQQMLDFRENHPESTIVADADGCFRLVDRPSGETLVAIRHAAAGAMHDCPARDRVIFRKLVRS